MVNVNWPTLTVQADFQHGANSGVQTWTNLQSTNNTTVQSVQIKRGRQYELNKNEAGTAEIDLLDFNEYLNPSNTASPWNSGVNSLLPYRQVQVQATWASTTYNLFTGYIERYPIGWDSAGRRGIRNLTCVDAMALLSRATIKYPARQQGVLAYTPYAYWPLSESNPSFPTPLNDISANPYNTTWTKGGATSFGATSPLAIADGTTCVSMTVKGGSSDTPFLNVSVPPISNAAMTMRMIFSYSNTVGANGAALVMSVELFSVVIQQSTAAGYIDITGIALDEAGNTISTTAYTVKTTGQAFDLTATLTQSGASGTLIIYLNGVQVSTVTGTLAQWLYNSWTSLNLDPTYASGTFTSTATVSDFAIWTSALTAAQVADLYTGGLTAWAGEPTVYDSTSTTKRGRVKRVLDTTGWTGLGSTLTDRGRQATVNSIAVAAPNMTITTAAAHSLVVGEVVTVAGTTSTANSGTFAVTAVPSSTQLTMLNPSAVVQAGAAGTVTSAKNGQSFESGAIGWAGSSVKSLLEKSATTEDANFFIGADGKVVVQDRQARRAPGASLYTFGDGTSELPYEDLSFSLDPSLIYNTVTTSNADGTNATSTDSGSTTAYFTSSLSLSTDYYNTKEVALRSQWTVAKYLAPVLRVEKMTINPSANTALWPAALGLEIGNAITINRRNVGVTMSSTYTIESIEHSIGVGIWRTTFWLSPLSLQRALILDDATYGVLDTYAISN